jgi:hypothetical protein
MLSLWLSMTFHRMQVAVLMMYITYSIAVLFARVGYADLTRASSPSLTSNAAVCSWTSPLDFVDKVRNLKLNITYIVSRCPDT